MSIDLNTNSEMTPDANADANATPMMTPEQREKLRKAAAFIRTIPAGGFDMGDPGKDFMSWMPKVFPEEVGMKEAGHFYLTEEPGEMVGYEVAGARLFGMSEYHAFNLFVADGQHAVQLSLPLCGKDGSAQEFAEMLEKFLEVEEQGELLPDVVPGSLKG